MLHRGSEISADDIRPLLRGVSATSPTGELVPVTGETAEDPSPNRERELIYRALLELRLEIRELKQQIMRAGSGGLAPQPPQAESDYYFYDEGADEDRVIEDAPFEIADEQYSTRSLPPGPAISEDNGQDVLPTLEDAEKELIAEALRRFEGNRRQTARALGISERTLYRKIREIEEEAGEL